MEIRSFNQLEKALKFKIQQAMENEVANMAKGTMQENIQKIVYDSYQPSDYERTYELFQSVETDMVDDNTLQVVNTRTDGDRYIPEIIESGQGYEWGYYRNLDEEIGARPFVAKTRESLEEGRFKDSLKKGLQAKGLKVE